MITFSLKRSCWLSFAMCVFACAVVPAYSEGEKETAKTESSTPAAKPASSKPAPPKPAPKPLEFVPGSWTLVLLPDIQEYSTKYPGLIAAQASWVVTNKEKYNIQFAMLLGDITNNNSTREWEHARDGLRIMDGKVPYAMTTGNHDYGATPKRSLDRDTLMNRYFPVSEMSKQPGFGGVMKEDHLENAYYLFTAGGSDWLILDLEWAPRDEVVDWANSICDKYPQRKAILVTHAYMYSDSTRYDFAKNHTSQTWNPHTYGPPGTVNDGEELWNKLVKKHDFVFTFNGHVLNGGTGYLASKNDLGKTTHQMLVNYQMRALGGEGYLRLVELLPDGKTVHVRSYSPLYDSYLTEPDQQFVLHLDE